jgi:hypothetical protein
LLNLENIANCKQLLVQFWDSWNIQRGVQPVKKEKAKTGLRAKHPTKSVVYKVKPLTPRKSVQLTPTKKKTPSKVTAGSIGKKQTKAKTKVVTKPTRVNSSRSVKNSKV